jgi:hypothetical protein
MQSSNRHNFQCIPNKASTWSDDEGFAWMEFEEGAEISGDDMVAIIEMATRTYREGEPFLVVIDMRKLDSISDEARNAAASNETARFYTALAIIANSPAMRLVANFYIRFHKPNRPTRIFNATNEALSWLRAYMPK